MKLPKIKIPRSVIKNITRVARKNTRPLLAVTSVASELGGLWYLYTHHQEIQEAVWDVKWEIKNSSDTSYEKAKYGVKRLTPVLGPNILLFSISTGCNLAGVAVANKEIAGLTAGLLLEKKRRGSLMDAIEEHCSSDEKNKIKDSVKKKELDDIPDKLPVMGYQWCKDLETGNWFQTTVEKIRHAEKSAVERIYLENYISINELYDSLDAPHVGVGDDMMFTLETGVDISIEATMAPDNKPCLAISYCWAYDSRY